VRKAQKRNKRSHNCQHPAFCKRVSLLCLKYEGAYTDNPKEMSPVIHLQASWIIGAYGTRDQRDCRLVAIAGLLPDADGLVLGLDLVNQWLGRPDSLFYATYHHFLFHGLLGALLTAALMAAFAKDRLRVGLLALIVFHFHLLCDLIGSRGPSPEDLWPIYYLGPFTKEPMWLWKGQWALDAWPNRLIGVIALVWSLWLAVEKGHSILGVFHRRSDGVVVAVLRRWRQRLLDLRRAKPLH
jgi:inner membrane protein